MQQFLVAVRRLDEDLRLLQPPRLFLQLAQRFFPFRIRDRKIAVKCETLSVQAGGHEREQYGGGADQRHDPDAVPVRVQHQFRAGVGDAGAARLGHHAQVVSGAQGRRQAGDVRVRRMLVQGGDAQLLQGLGRADLLQIRARGLGVFGDEVLQRAHPLLHVLRDHRRKRAVAQRGRNEKQRAGGHGQRGFYKTLTPCAASISVSAISGSPIRALGSSPRISAMSAMPRPSQRALPAQS